MFSDQVLLVSTQPLLCIPPPELISEVTIDLIGQKCLKPRRTSLPTLPVTSSKSFPETSIFLLLFNSTLLIKE
jgi:hypothetical protein